MRKWSAAAAAAAPASVMAATARATADPANVCGASHWVGSWTAAPSDALSISDPSLIPQWNPAGQTYRLVITPHRGGSTVRVHLTNRSRPAAISIGHVTIGVQAERAAARAGSLREIIFDGRRKVTIPAWGDVVSDPAEVSFDAFEHLSISVHVPDGAAHPAQHYNANATSYYSPPWTGDHTADAAGTALALNTTSIPLLSGLGVIAPSAVSTIVVLGDSITDGWSAATALGLVENRSMADRDTRYPDFLQHRLDAARAPFTVLNAGISGNRVGRDGAVPMFGPNALSRIQADVLNQAVVTEVIVLKGINDLGIPVGAGYGELIAGYTALIERVHAAGLRVHLGTIPPTSNSLVDGILTFPWQNRSCNASTPGSADSTYLIRSLISTPRCAAPPTRPCSTPGSPDPTRAGHGCQLCPPHLRCRPRAACSAGAVACGRPRRSAPWARVFDVEIRHRRRHHRPTHTSAKILPECWDESSVVRPARTLDARLRLQGKRG